MVQGLSVSNVVNIQVNLEPQAVANRSFGNLLILGDSNVIDAVSRFREYTDLPSVAADFGTTAPEYLAADLYFGQTPQPAQCMIGRWLRTASAGLLEGALLTSAQQLPSAWTSITAGAFKVQIDGGSVESVTGLNFSSITNMNGVASVINAVMTGATIAWNGKQFIITSATTGTSSAVNYVTSPASGTDISTDLGLTAALALPPIPGFASETPVAAIQALDNLSADWYGSMFAASVQPTTVQNEAVAAFIQGDNISRIFGITTQDSNTLVASYNSDEASAFLALGYTRTLLQYSSSSPYAVASLFGRMFSVDFNANNSTITLMFKQEPGIVAEVLSASQAAALKAKRCNVFVAYQNGAAIVQYGMMSGLAYIDEIHGLDWFQNALQTAEFNLLYQSPTKIPQTDAGANQLVAVANAICAQAVNNGLVAPGQWNSQGFGQLQYGQYLKTGYYIYIEPMALQDQSDREARIAPPMQIALKLAGAIQDVIITVNANR